MIQKRTKIVCTIGPSSGTQETLEQMVNAGMNVARLNFSHGTHENHLELIKNIRAVAKKTGKPIAILQDLQGPKIRVGNLPNDGYELEDDAIIIFDTGIDNFTENRIPIDYDDLHKYLKPGERILLSDGKIEVIINSVEGTQITAKVVVGGTIFSHKGINVPDSTLEIRALTEKDKQDARFGVDHGVDLMALSFVTSPEDILDLRHTIKVYETELGIEPEQPISIIAKIERYEAVEGIDAILEVVDGIMVARGDLGIEIPAQKVPVVQKQLIDKAMSYARPVIVATQMLDSMQDNPRPTRAEVSDVANAVIDHTDAVMLSNETATGKYPVIVVETMSNIIQEAEKSAYDNLTLKDFRGEKEEIDDVISRLSRILAEQVHAKVILAASISGETGRLISSNRPELAIAVATNVERTRNQLNLSWGVHPFILSSCSNVEDLLKKSVLVLKDQDIVSDGDNIIIVSGDPVGYDKHVNVLEVRKVE